MRRRFHKEGQPTKISKAVKMMIKSKFYKIKLKVCKFRKMHCEDWQNQTINNLKIITNH